MTTTSRTRSKKPSSRYEAIIERVFFARYREGATEVPFERDDIARAARALRVKLPKNLGDVIYSPRYRTGLPKRIRDTAPKSLQWVIRPAGRARYLFALVRFAEIAPSRTLVETKVPDATPGIVAMYSLSDEQALLAKLRYNRLVDIFTGVACYSLQNHLRTAVTGMGQVETDEIYIGVDKKGVHYAFPVQAKGKRDKINIVQIEQDLAMCRSKFPTVICRPLGAQFLQEGLIAMFEFEHGDEGVRVVSEKHYRLVPPDEVTPDDLSIYGKRLE